MSQSAAERFLAIVRAGPPHNLPVRVYECWECEDSGFIVRSDDKGRRWGRRCQPCLGRDRAKAPKPEVTPFDELRSRREMRRLGDDPF